MKTVTPQPLAPSTGRLLLGYSASVITASLSLEVCLATRHAFNHGFEAGSLVFHLGDSVIFGLVMAIMVAVAAALPCLLAESLAKLLGIWSAWWFALWGAATSLGLGTLGAALPDVAGEYAHVLKTYWVDFVLSGALGGLTHWLVSQKLLAAEAPRRPAPSEPP